MRIAARAALVAAALTACGKGGDAPRAGSAPPQPAVAAPAPAAPAPPRSLGALAMPEVAAAAHVDPVPAGGLVVVAADHLAFEGQRVAAVADGQVDAAARDTATGRITALTTAARAWAASAPPATVDAPRWMLAAVAPQQPMPLVLDVIASLAGADQRDIALLVRTPEATGAVPLHLPAHAAPPAAGEPATLGMVVSFTTDALLVWSLSGEEGTLAEPLLRMPRAAADTPVALRTRLADIAKKRWGAAARPAKDRTLVLLVGDDVTMAEAVATMITVRHDATGQELFPDVQLGRALEPVAVAVAPKAPDPVAARTDRVALEEEEAARFAQMLSSDTGDESDLRGTMERTRPGSDLAAQIDAVRESGAQVAVGGGAVRGDGGTTIGGTARGPLVDEADAGTPPGPVGRIQVVAKTALDDTSLTTDAVLAKVQSVYMAGVKRCYKQALKTDPTLTGTLRLRFTVNETGRATDVTSEGPRDEVATCVTTIAVSWRFPVPRDADADATDARFELRLRLVPE